jgi:hypothetical protein
MRKYDKENQSNMFKKYYADVEYNRMRNGDIKQYEDSRKVKQKMVSDLLIHENRDGHGKKTDEDLNFRYDEMLRELVRI